MEKNDKSSDLPNEAAILSLTEVERAVDVKAGMGSARRRGDSGGV